MNHARRGAEVGQEVENATMENSTNSKPLDGCDVTTSNPANPFVQWMQENGAAINGENADENSTATAECEDDYFGLCPDCKKSDGYLNVSRSHWGVCHEHKLRWAIGANLFSSWRDEDEETWRRNEETLLGYTEIKPYYHPTPEVEVRDNAETEKPKRFFSDKSRPIASFETTFSDANGDSSGPHRCMFVEDRGRITACLDVGWLHYMKQLVGDFSTLGEAVRVLNRTNSFLGTEDLQQAREDAIDELFKVINGLWDNAEKAGAKPNEFVGDGVPF